MSIKQKMKTVGFWISLVSAILIVASIIASHYKKTIDEVYIMDIVTGVCSVLVVLGLLTPSSVTSTEEPTQTLQAAEDKNNTESDKDDITSNTNETTENSASTTTDKNSSTQNNN